MLRVPEQNNELFVKTIRAVLEENYDLGKLTRVKQMLGGYCNKSYAVWLSANDLSHRYLLRLYNPGVIESEILFEHALINHLICNGFRLAPAIVLCRNKATVVHSPPPADHRGTKAFWALFEFLEGEDKYSWTDTDLTDNEFTQSAEILAHFHHCGHGFKKPFGTDRAQPPIMEFIPTFEKTFSAFLKRADDRRCDRLFKDNFELICKALDTAASFETRFQGMPQIPIHCDYHPGNLKFRDEEVVGLFDLDWSKIDYRLFDVALSLVYFTSIWDEKAAGLRPDKFTLFLGKYNQACQRLAHNRPFSNQERRCLVPMMSIANLYVLNWDLVDFYHNPERDDDAYYTFIDHNIGLNHWIARNEDQLERWVKNELN